MSLSPGRTVAELRELQELTGDENGAQRVAWTETWERAPVAAREGRADRCRGGDRRGREPVGSRCRASRNARSCSAATSIPCRTEAGSTGALNVLAAVEVLRRIKIQDACALTYSDAAFDSVVGSSILHHLEIEPALREIRRVLKPGGTIYFTEPNMLNPQIAVQKNIPWIKRKLGDSPDETAFFRWPLRRLLERTGYRDIRIDPFDFLHPKTPIPLINRVNQFGRFFEKMPVISEFAGSLYIRAVK